jgi:PAS domain S-box-containing protein
MKQTYYKHAAVPKTEEQYRRLVDLSPEAIAVHSQGVLLYVNQAGARLVGAKYPSEVIGQPVMQFVHPDYQDIVVKRVKQIYEQKKPTDLLQEKFVRLDGEVIDVEVISMPFEYAGKPSIQLVVRDITERKKIEKRQEFLEQVSETLFTSFDKFLTLQKVAQLIVPSLADYCRIAIVNGSKDIQEIAVSHKDPTKAELASSLYDSYKNRPENTHGVHKILASGKAEMISRIDKQVFDSVKENKKLIQLMKDLGLTSYMGVPLIARKKVIGALTFSSVSPTRIYKKEDLLFVKEVGRRIALALENARLYKEAKEAITLRDDFISVASHELKTPITSVKMFTQILQQNSHKNGDSQAFEYLGKMDKQLNKLTDLVYNLLNISKIQTGRMEYKQKMFDFNKMVLEVVEMLQQSESKHKLLVKGKTTKKVYGDEDRLSQIVTNLISNAIKYSPNADKVLITLSEKGDSVVLAVQDFGIGIAKHHVDKIFERFYRVHGATGKTFPGLGIGLYICKEIVKRHKGKLWVESETGKGSTFYFSLPVGRQSQTIVS